MINDELEIIDKLKKEDLSWWPIGRAKVIEELEKNPDLD